ncbi:hypothetical protein B0T21DRAFT_384792 [Apiosordaria backusii]|uniref:Uncharacterized protein n=1 Tax=Apiosordaria backusii TaxID=314023 RepID=A0AA40BE48_9PEZI|nr:hypothetical protein B0T21DRAFT_384792 [Apiosordaria backusii]
MSFTLTLRAGLAPRLASQFAKPSTAMRAFHQSAKQNAFFTSRTAFNTKNSSSNILARLRGSTRGYQQQSGYAYYDPAARRKEAIRKLIIGGAIFGGTLVAVNVMFNGESREGGMPAFERKYLNQTFLHTGLGVGIIGMTAYQMVQSGFVYRIMQTNPWAVGLGGLALSIGSMMATRSIDPDNYVPKYTFWTLFNATQAAFVAPLMDKYLYIGGPLLAGAAIVAVSGFAPLVLPVTAVRTLAVTENLWLWGGLAVFGGFTLYDVQKVLHHARLAERGLIKRDPVNESISFELDFLNIFVRMVQILMMQQRRK